MTASGLPLQGISWVILSYYFVMLRGVLLMLCGDLQLVGDDAEGILQEKLHLGGGTLLDWCSYCFRVV
jgi:hypothetical protein